MLTTFEYRFNLEQYFNPATIYDLNSDLMPCGAIQIIDASASPLSTQITFDSNGEIQIELEAIPSEDIEEETVLVTINFGISFSEAD